MPLPRRADPSVLFSGYRCTVACFIKVANYSSGLVLQVAPLSAPSIGSISEVVASNVSYFGVPPFFGVMSTRA